MDEEELWMPADDETIRGALDTLRWRTEALPLADVRFVKARGKSRRRRAFVVGATATAAAVAVVGIAGFNALGPNQALDLSPATPPTTSTSTTSTRSAALPPLGGSLPVLAEWQRVLGTIKVDRGQTVDAGAIHDTTDAPELAGMYLGQGNSSACPVASPGTPLRTDVVKASPPVHANQGVYYALSADAGNTAAAAAVRELVNCQVTKVKVEADASWPKVFSSHTANSHTWYVVAHQGALTTLITVNTEGSGPRLPLEQVQVLASIAQQRLVQVELSPATPLRPSASATTQADPSPATTQTAR